MALKTLQNFYKATVSTAWAAGTGNRYVSVLPTPTSGTVVINSSNISKREIVDYSAIGTDAGGNYLTLSARGIGGTTNQTHAVGESVRMNLTAEMYTAVQTELDLKLDDSQLDTDGTLAVNSDTKIASQKATKTYADAITTNVTTLNAQNVKLTGDQTISSGIKTFVVSPIVPTPTTSTQAASKGYADGLAIAGSPNSSTTVKGIGQVSVAPASPTTPIFVGDNDPRVPTQAENDALAGTGIPSSSNKYVTYDTFISSYLTGSNGSDGNVTISTPTTLTRDMYYDNLTVNSTLTTDGWIIYVKGTINGTGSIIYGFNNNGGNAINTNGSLFGQGGQGNIGKRLPSLSGGNGGSGSLNGNQPGPGQEGTSSTSGIGKNGGNSGNAGNNGASPAFPQNSTGGNISVIKKFGIFSFNTFNMLDTLINGSFTNYLGGAGGAGGAGGSYNGNIGQIANGGGGGGGGGVIFISANNFSGSFSLIANGGNGGNGSSVGSPYNITGGGGGGGGGGAVVILYNTKTWTGVYNVFGGLAGAHSGIGTAPQNGQDGNVYEIEIKTLTR
jgi:hypothetical protein